MSRGKRKSQVSKEPVCALCGAHLPNISQDFNLDELVIRGLALPRGLDLHHVVIQQIRDDFREELKQGLLAPSQCTFAGGAVDTNLMVIVHKACHKQFNNELAYFFTFDPDEDDTVTGWFLRQFPEYGLFTLAGKGGGPARWKTWIPRTRAKSLRDQRIDWAIEDDIAFETFS